ncbi:CGNR zinc finger domain-containing protein [Gordonia malaquae]|nr:CGNR zinc finger domain-containing protein [Gordonia malaquae]SEB97541.1 CGNR zinc finger domain-containing protein [Gordonia malaquae]
MTGPLLSADLVNLIGEGWSAQSVGAVFAQHTIRRPDFDDGGLAELRRWAVRLRTVFEAVDEDATCDAINALLVDGAGQVYLTTHGHFGPHLHFAPDDSDVVSRVMAVTSGGLAVFTVEAGGRRLGACARSDCDRVFVDTSRNGRRTYCSARCGNTDAVSRHRSRARLKV